MPPPWGVLTQTMPTLGYPKVGFCLPHERMDHTSLLLQPFYTAKRNPTTKSVDMSPLGDFWYEAAKDKDEPDAFELFKSVPWLWRCVELRANAVAAMPFRIVAGDTDADDFDNSDDYQNALGWLPDPRRLLWLTEAALTCFGSAYWWQERNRIVITGMRYIRPDTIEPQIDETKGLTGFKRNINGRQVDVPVKSLVYFWLPDPWVELGPPQSSPAMAALAAANVLNNLDKFSAAYFARGAIKATLLAVSGAPIASERDKLKSWWRDVVSGIKNAFATEIVNADHVSPVVIGEGLKELSNADLTDEKRQDIATALGVPMSVIFSDGAGGLGGGGVVAQDDKHFYEKTIIPQCQIIAAVLNAQILQPLGLRLTFTPEALDAFQEDENQRAAAFSAYVSAGLPVELVGGMLGLELPAGWTWERVAAEKEKARQEAMEDMQARTGPMDHSEDHSNEEEGQKEEVLTKAAMVADLRKWRAKSKKRGSLAPFESDAIPEHVIADIKAHSENGWLEAIDAAIEQPEYAELVTALRDATKAVLDGYAAAE